MVGGFFAFLEDIGHAEGVAHFDEPITQRRCEAVIKAVETAKLPWRDVLFLGFLLFHVHNVVATNGIILGNLLSALAAQSSTKITD